MTDFTSTPFTRQFKKDCDALARRLHMPDDIVVVRNKDADEAGDYRLARHGDVVEDPNWEITDIRPEELD